MSSPLAGRIVSVVIVVIDLAQGEPPTGCVRTVTSEQSEWQGGPEIVFSGWVGLLQAVVELEQGSKPGGSS